MQIDFSNPTLPRLKKEAGFIKRKYSFGWLLKDAARVFTRVPDIYAIAVRNRLPEDFREEIMVAVSRANGCTICNFTHHDFAQHAGLSLEKLQQLERADYSNYDPEKKVAIDYAIARSLAEFGPIDPALQREFERIYTRQEQYDIDFVARFITIMNLCCNKLEALYSRTQGVPAENSRLPSELAISGIAMIIIPVMYGLVALTRKESFAKVVSDFFEFAQHYEQAVDPILHV